MRRPISSAPLKLLAALQLSGRCQERAGGDRDASPYYFCSCQKGCQKRTKGWTHDPSHAYWRSCWYKQLHNVVQAMLAAVQHSQHPVHQELS